MRARNSGIAILTTNQGAQKRDWKSLDEGSAPQSWLRCRRLLAEGRQIPRRHSVQKIRGGIQCKQGSQTVLVKLTSVLMHGCRTAYSSVV